MLKQMNNVLSDWTALYDVFSVLRLDFHEDQHGILYFREKPLCSIYNLTLLSAQIEAERISYQFNAGQYIHVYLDWSEDDLPRLYSVCFGHEFPREQFMEKETAERET